MNHDDASMAVTTKVIVDLTTTIAVMKEKEPYIEDFRGTSLWKCSNDGSPCNGNRAIRRDKEQKRDG